MRLAKTGLLMRSDNSMTRKGCFGLTSDNSLHSLCATLRQVNLHCRQTSSSIVQAFRQDNAAVTGRQVSGVRRRRRCGKEDGWRDAHMVERLSRK